MPGGEAGGQEQEMAQSGMPGPLFFPSPELEESQCLSLVARMAYSLSSVMCTCIYITCVFGKVGYSGGWLLPKDRRKKLCWISLGC